MANIKLSVVIPGYKDPYSQDTIRDLLKNSELGDQLEIIHVWDGFYPTFEIVQDPRVRYVHLGSNRGMRGAINSGMNVARGEFVGRMDEHVSVGPGWDKILTESCQSNWIMVPKRFFLNPVEWKIMDIPPVEHERLVIQDMGNGVRKFSGQRWKSRDAKQKDVMISETQACQGSFWIMSKKNWDDNIGELSTEGYGPTYQDSVEVCMKTWKAGGKLFLNKNTWYSHKHRDFPRTHQEGSKENPSNREQSWKHALDVWESYYRDELLPKWKYL